MRHAENYYKIALGLLLTLLAYVVIVNAWVVDDAYITFRVVDNFIHGRGLVWNAGERVQVYTHPLWMFVVAIFSFVTRDVFYTSLSLSFLLFFSSVVLVAWRLRSWGFWRPLLWTALILASKAIVDFSSSGLENALSAFLAAVFFATFLLIGRDPSELTKSELSLLFCVASLAFTNRQDTILLYLPALVYIVVIQRNLGKDLFTIVIISTLPASLWLTFSLFYYGFPLPNTAYAKVVYAKVPLIDRIDRGFYYFYNSLRWDTLSHAVVLMSLVMTVLQRQVPSVLAIGGILLYFSYILVDAAAATHMSGRFFSVPFFIAFLVGSFLIRRQLAYLFAAGVVCSLLLNPWSPLKFGTRFYGMSRNYYGIIDARWYGHREGSSLVSVKKGVAAPDHRWLHAGEEFRLESARVRVGAASSAPAAVGFFGYGAGPDKYIVDFLGLTDPLLSHLRPCNTSSASDWAPGHFFRTIPDGYIESLQLSRNVIRDPDLRLYYDKLISITRGPLFSRRRILDIVGMNTGRYDSLLNKYDDRTANIDWPVCLERIVAAIGSH